MVFIVKSSEPKAALAAYLEKKHAFMRLSLFPIGVTEQLLNRYLIENYNITLALACRKIILRASYMLNLNNEIVITIPDKELDEIAMIITYGTGKLVGSGILKFVLNSN